jgi:hypothetical protein
LDAAHLTRATQVATGAWSGHAFIQYDVSEVAPNVFSAPRNMLTLDLQGGSYEGGVEDGKYHGWGRLTDTLGQVWEGQWLHGEFFDE